MPPELIPVLGELAKLVVLSLILERAMVLLFEYRWYEKKLSGIGLKVPITYIVSLIVCYSYKFNILATLFPPETLKTNAHTSSLDLLGIIITAAIVAGGSAGAITLFQGMWGFFKEAQEKLKKAKIAKAEADFAVAKARKDNAEAESKAIVSEMKAREAEAKAREKYAG